MSTPCQLATMIEMVAPRLHPALVCRDNVDSILAISRVLPSWQCAGFECRLGDPAPRADFGVHLRRTHGIPIDEELLGQGGPLDADSALTAWRRLRSFARAWSGDAGSFCRRFPRCHWSSTFTVPELHASPRRQFFSRFGSGLSGPGRANAGAVKTCSAVVQAVLDALGVHAAGAGHKLEECFRVLLPRVSFLQFGVWLGRSVDTFRIWRRACGFVTSAAWCRRCAGRDRPRPTSRTGATCCRLATGARCISTWEPTSPRVWVSRSISVKPRRR